MRLVSWHDSRRPGSWLRSKSSLPSPRFEFADKNSDKFTMIKRVFLRQCKSVLPPATSRSISHLHTPFRSRHTQPLASILAKSLPPRLGARWQSTETDAEARTNPDLGPVPSDGSKAPAAEDASKKELEGKNREIIELKVSHTIIAHGLQMSVSPCHQP